MDRPPISLYRTADVRQIDRDAIGSGTSGFQLMERAAAVSLKQLSDRYPAARSVLVLCGAGNNAGDGYVLARLAQQSGMVVSVCVLSPVEKLQGDALRAWKEFAGFATANRDLVAGFSAKLLTQCDVVVDALLGTGLSRDVEGEYAEVIQAVNEARVEVVSLDVPSGLDSDSGLPRPVAIKAALTVTFIAPKVGLYTGQSSAYCGRIVCDPLGLDDELYRQYAPAARTLVEGDARKRLPSRNAWAHKGHHGRVLVVGGTQGMSGAVALTAEAVLRSGAGTVTVACHKRSRQIVAGYMPEIMCVGVSGIEKLQALISACDVIAVGPGMGRGAWGKRLFDCVYQSDRPLVVDADGLRWLADYKGQRGSGPVIVTPHPGEAAGLLDSSSGEIQTDRLGSAQKIARKFGAVTVLKGDRTVVATNGELPAICGLGNPGMATAGSGDVLTGIVAGIWAQQSDPQATAFGAASAAVYVHAQAGDRAALDGERGLISSDILNHVRHCVNFDV